MLWLIIIALPAYAIMSLLTFGAFYLDKRRAKLDLRRTPEKTLHTLSFLGGFPGALAAMVLVRHKNRKPMFVAITLSAAAAHAILWIALFALALRLTRA